MNRITRILFSLFGVLAAWPAQAQNYDGINDPATGWDHLWNEVLIDITVIGVIFGIAAIYMMIRYRAKSPEDVGSAKPLSSARAWGWALIPAAIFMADDFFLSAKGWTLWNAYRQVPENALEIKATAQMYSWEFDYGNGVLADELLVPVGQPVVLRMTSMDVLHSFFLTEFRVKEDVMPGRITYLWFHPREPLETFVTCVEFCGTGHSVMATAVKVLPVDDYTAWMTEAKAEADAEAVADAAGTES